MKITKISNPLTIVGVFATVAEVATVTSLKNLPIEILGIYIWFIMLFPVLLVMVFFITLNFNPKVLYAPSDFENENNFILLLTKQKIEHAIEQVESIETKLTVEGTDNSNKDELLRRKLIESYKESEISSVRNFLVHSGITNQEKEIIRLIVEGYNTNSKIAGEIGITRERARQMLESLLDKALILYDKNKRTYFVHEVVERALVR